MKTFIKHILLLVTGVILSIPCLFAQADTIPVRDEQVGKPVTEERHGMDLGVGFGLDYGGLLGLQIGIAPAKHLTFFGGLGYYVQGLGWQVGIKGLFVPKTTLKGTRPYIKMMYGTHSQIQVEGAEEFNEIYKGFTAGFGIEFRGGKKKQNGLDLDLNIPLRTPEFWDDYNDLQNNSSIEFTNSLLPVTVSIGFHHEF